MKRISKLVLLIALLAGLVYGVNYIWQAFPIISGYGAKNLCSCVYVAGRTAESVVNNELGSGPLSLGTFYIDTTDSSVYGEVLGMAVRKAIYRKGLGCTLISELKEEAIRAQPYNLKPIVNPSDSLPWPVGVQKPDSIHPDIDRKALARAVNKAFEERDPERLKNTRAIVVVHNGQLIIEKYAEGFDRDTPQMGWSMTKSMTNAMIALLVKEGKLNIREPAPVDQWQGEGDPRKAITIDHMLRMSSGLEWEEEYGEPSPATNMLFEAADMGKHAAGFPLAHPPDTKWVYSSGTSNILSKIIRQTIGEEEYNNYIREKLLSKLGMASAVIEPDASGTYVGSSYMYATPRDWARFGMLYLNDGVWEGERMLPEGWVDYSVTPTHDAPQGKYGAHFWLNAGAGNNPQDRWYPDAPVDVYSMNGYEGQRVFVIPSRQAVVVRLGLTKRGHFDFNEFLKEVLVALPESL